jgi:hypothetical protein
MRTKTLLLTAALALAGTATMSAQVYSVNAVGYVNVTFKKGFTLAANPLNATDNKVAALFASAPDGTVIYKFTAAGTYDINGKDFGEFEKPNDTMVPGEGVFVLAPADFTVTFVGEVPQGALKNSVPKGFSIKSSIVPQSGKLSTDLGFPAADGDFVYLYRNGAYAISGYDFGEWDSEPTPAVAEAFFVNKAAAVDWNRNFSVNQ